MHEACAGANMEDPSNMEPNDEKGVRTLTASAVNIIDNFPKLKLETAFEG